MEVVKEFISLKSRRTVFSCLRGCLKNYSLTQPNRTKLSPTQPNLLGTNFLDAKNKATRQKNGIFDSLSASSMRAPASLRRPLSVSGFCYLVSSANICNMITGTDYCLQASICRILLGRSLLQNFP